MIRALRFLGHQIPYGLRSFWIADANKKALDKHVDKPYKGNVLLIRAPDRRGPVYRVSGLGWNGVLNGKVIVKYVDIEHESFMESGDVHDILQDFLSTNAVARTKK